MKCLILPVTVSPILFDKKFSKFDSYPAVLVTTVVSCTSAIIFPLSFVFLISVFVVPVPDSLSIFMFWVPIIDEKVYENYFVIM